MSNINQRLIALGYELPAPFEAPPGVELRFEPVLVRGHQAWVSGAGPVDGSTILRQGIVGQDLSVDDGRDAARLTALGAIASLRAVLGDLDRITGWAEVAIYVNSAPQLPGLALTQVADGFSVVLLDIWGDAGRHARVAPGVHALPLNLPLVARASLLVLPA